MNIQKIVDEYIFADINKIFEEVWKGYKKSTSKFGELLGLSNSTVYKIVHYKAVPSEKAVVCLCIGGKLNNLTRIELLTKVYKMREIDKPRDWAKKLVENQDEMMRIYRAQNPKSFAPSSRTFKIPLNVKLKQAWSRSKGNSVTAVPRELIKKKELYNIRQDNTLMVHVGEKYKVYDGSGYINDRSRWEYKGIGEVFYVDLYKIGFIINGFRECFINSNISLKLKGVMHLD